MWLSKLKNCYFLSLLICLSVTSLNLQAQTKRRIHIEHSDYMRSNKKIISNANRLIGHVKVSHGEIQMWCDSAYAYTDTNMIDAFGHVHIIKSDTLNIYADFINYNGDRQWAVAKGNVKLVNKQTILTTDTLNYDMENSVGYYDDYGTIKDSTNTLHSKIGQYYTRQEKAYFKTKVNARTPNYTMLSDTLIYQPQKGITTIVGPTRIFDKKTILTATSGIHNSKTGEVRLYKRPVITSGTQQITADSIFYNKISGNGLAMGDANIEDKKNHIIVKGNRAVYNDIKQTAMMTDSAELLLYSPQDTLFLHSDTLISMPDSVPGEKLVRGYYKARFYRTDLQGKCDSLVYWSKDSTIQLFHSPVLWSGSNQMTADYIKLITLDSLSQTIKMNGNSFIIAQEDSTKFNQIKGRDMTGHIHNRDLYQIDVDGNGESIYYARDSQGIIGLNKAESSSILIKLKDSHVQRISFINSPDGQLSPLPQVSDEQNQLDNFQWLDALRPKSRTDIFIVPAQEIKKEQK